MAGLFFLIVTSVSGCKHPRTIVRKGIVELTFFLRQAVMAVACVSVD